MPYSPCTEYVPHTPRTLTSSRQVRHIWSCGCLPLGHVTLRTRQLCLVRMSQRLLWFAALLLCVAGEVPLHAHEERMRDSMRAHHEEMHHLRKIPSDHEGAPNNFSSHGNVICAAFPDCVGRCAQDTRAAGRSTRTWTTATTSFREPSSDPSGSRRRGGQRIARASGRRRRNAGERRSSSYAASLPIACTLSESPCPKALYMAPFDVCCCSDTFCARCERRRHQSPRRACGLQLYDCTRTVWRWTIRIHRESNSALRIYVQRRSIHDQGSSGERSASRASWSAWYLPHPTLVLHSSRART